MKAILAPINFKISESSMYYLMHLMFAKDTAILWECHGDGYFIGMYSE